MATVRIKIDLEALTLSIEENDRGQWEVWRVEEECYFAQGLAGYGGENILHVHLSPMQGGTLDAVLVYWRIDNPHEVRHLKYLNRYSLDRVEREIELLIQDPLAGEEESP